jgi:hypothetical protein
MAACDLRDSCFFFNYGLSGMKRTSEFLRFKYCKGDFTKCPWYVNCKGLWEEAEE